MPARADGFIRRPETAPDLGAALLPGTSAALVPARRAAAGSPDWLASCGKSQLAAAHARSLWQAGELDLLVWVTATDRASVLSGYLAAAEATLGEDLRGDAEDSAARLLSWLGDTSQSWLMVLDGLADAADLDGLWPAGPAGRVLITTSEPGAIGQRPRTQPLPVEMFSPREALGYLMGRLTADPDQRLGALDLVRDLGCEPLALAQASAVIASTALSCRDYSAYFARRRDELAAATPGVQPSAAQVAWTFSVEQADRLSPDGTARAVLALAALLGARGAPGVVFTTAAARGYLADGGVPAPVDAERIRTGLRDLERAGLLTVDLTGVQPVVRMNAPVQAAVRAAMPDALLTRTVRAAADALLEAWPADDQGGWLAAALRSCAASLRRAAGDRLWADQPMWPGGCHPMLLRAGQSLDAGRLTGPAVSYWQDLAATSDRLLGPAQPDPLVGGVRLASELLAAGRAADAVPWFQWILAKRVPALGPHHPDTLAARRDLGRALTAAGQYSDAIAVLATAAADYERVCGPDHPDTLSARDGLAAAYRAAGQFEDAVELGRRTLGDRERTQGARHPDTTRTRQQLADGLLAADLVKDAVAQYKRVLADRERALGADDPDTIAARASLGAAYQAAGRKAAALQLYEQARTGYERVLGADHPLTQAVTDSLADIAGA